MVETGYMSAFESVLKFNLFRLILIHSYRTASIITISTAVVNYVL